MKNAYYGEDYKFYLTDKKLILENNSGSYELEQYNYNNSFDMIW